MKHRKVNLSIIHYGNLALRMILRVTWFKNTPFGILVYGRFCEWGGLKIQHGKTRACKKKSKV